MMQWSVHEKSPLEKSVHVRTYTLYYKHSNRVVTAAYSYTWYNVEWSTCNVIQMSYEKGNNSAYRDKLSHSFIY
jgi:hypothetical protein